MRAPDRGFGSPAGTGIPRGGEKRPDGRRKLWLQPPLGKLIKPSISSGLPRLLQGTVRAPLPSPGRGLITHTAGRTYWRSQKHPYSARLLHPSMSAGLQREAERLGGAPPRVEPPTPTPPSGTERPALSERGNQNQAGEASLPRAC